ncbi:RHD3/Sey1 [Carpediemonas membranifera]|uniref:RHD3/Sey1 n=1 Tax=Carpediemonas membranifera TaxID=201153 RepID=A0A8J6BZW0_9EUKA|nr:RHD3/Sey1 [Carpediemonas membranifera]|eukprot:KAG9395931.1 RHD3/Sey1 [Carpediemonas membranifera]
MRVLHKHSIRVTNVKRNAEGRNEVENNDSKRKLKKILAGDIPVVSFYGARGTGSSLLANNLFGSRFNVNCDRNHPTKGMQTQMSCLEEAERQRLPALGLPGLQLRRRGRPQRRPSTRPAGLPPLLCRRALHVYPQRCH